MNTDNINKQQEEEILDENDAATGNEAIQDETAEGVETTEAGEKSLEEQLAEANQTIAEMKDKYLRQAAEFDNYRKRTMKEKAEFIKNGGEKVITAILPIIDDMERARATKASDLEAMTKGFELIYDKFLDILKKEGLEAIDAVGKPFDVDFHEAIAMIPGQPDELKGKVLDCVTTGYKLNDKVIRHSKVAVGE